MGVKHALWHFLTLCADSFETSSDMHVLCCIMVTGCFYPTVLLLLESEVCLLTMSLTG